MNFTVTLPASALKAVARAMANGDLRYYLNGALIEHNGAETRLVATDGHRMHAVRIEHAGALVSPIVTAIMPRDFVLSASRVKPFSRKDDPKPTLIIDTAAGKCALRYAGSETIALLIDGVFPYYRKFIPAGAPSLEHATFNPQYIADAYAALNEFQGRKADTPPEIGFASNGNTSGVLSAPNFLAIVMPLRAEISTGASHEFRQPLQAPETAAA